MILPAEFRFSQASLQDHADCPRRFRLRYIDRLDWPSQESQPALEHERQMLLGTQFHRMVQQHQTGIDADRIEKSIGDAELQGWWRNYLNFPIPGLPANRRCEYALSAPLAGFRLLAKFDLLAWAPGERAVIVDWKTSPQAAPRRRLADRLQTRVYPWVLAEAGAHLNGGEPFRPEQISLVYWFASAPDSPEVFEYRAAAHAAAGVDLAALIQRIASSGEGDFPLTDDEQRCRFCVYRSLCDRGVAAGTAPGFEGSLADAAPAELEAALAGLDFDQIAEIEF